MNPNSYLRVLTWDQVHSAIFELAGSIVKSNYKPDLIIGIGYGGIIPSTLMYFVLPEVEFTILYPGKKLESGIDQIENLEGKNVLVVDDLANSGDSLQATLDMIKAKKPKEVKAACLFCSESYDKLDYFTRHILPNELLVFPWYRCDGDSKGMKILKYRGRFGKHEPIDE